MAARPVRVAAVMHGLGVLATRRIEKGEMIWEEAPIVCIRHNTTTQMADPELRPLLEKCMALGEGHGILNDTAKPYPQEVAALMAQVTEINCQRAYATLPADARHDWTCLMSEFGVAAGCRAHIVGLASDAGAHVNGRAVTVVDFNEASSRWNCQLRGEEAEGVPTHLHNIALRAVNLATLGGIFRTNAMGYKSNEYEASAALYSLFCRCNHSCNPNVNKKIDAATGKLQAFANTVLREGTELKITYTGLQLPVHKRRELLRSKYAFTCECERCRHELRAESGLRP